MKNQDEDNLALARKMYLPAMVLTGVGFIVVATLTLWGEVGMANEKTAESIGLWLNFFGKLHPLFLHLPIGAMTLVYLMEAAGIVTRGKYRPNTTLGLFLAASTGVFAAVFGYFLFLSGGYEGELIEAHKRDGILFSLLMLGAFAIKYTYDVKGRMGWLKAVYFVMLAGTGVMMLSAGHHGGEISHGDPMDSLPSKVMEKRKKKESAPVVTDPVVFLQYIQPIMEAKCTSCHGEDKKKGSLRLDSYAFMLDGGEEFECLVPGDVKESALISSLHLPMEDDLHMPPEGKTQLTAEEIQILEWWVAIGAPEKLKKSQVEVPAVVEEALATLLTPEQQLKMENAKKAELAQKLKLDSETRAEISQSLIDINEKYSGSLGYVSRENTDLIFSAVSHRKTFGDSDVSALKPVAAYLVEVDFSSTHITDASSDALKQMVNLKKVKLSSTQVTDEMMKVMSALPNIEVINVYDTAVSDAGLGYFKGHRKLRKVYAWDSKVTSAGAKKFEAMMADLAKKSDADGEDRVAAKVILGISS